MRPPCAPSGAPRAAAPTGVLVIPGFLTGDWATARLRDFLDGLGYVVEGWGQGTNWGPRAPVLAALEAAVDRLAERTGRPVAAVGQSLGGVFARELAKRRPQAVSRVVTLCTPIRFPVATPLAPAFWALKPLMDHGFLALARQVAEPPPAPLGAIYSRRDGIVDWRACVPDLRPGDEAVEVDAGHTTVASNPQAQAQVARLLAGA